MLSKLSSRTASAPWQPATADPGRCRWHRWRHPRERSCEGNTGRTRLPEPLSALPAQPRRPGPTSRELGVKFQGNPRTGRAGDDLFQERRLHALPGVNAACRTWGLGGSPSNHCRAPTGGQLGLPREAARRMEDEGGRPRALKAVAWG